MNIFAPDVHSEQGLSNKFFFICAQGLVLGLAMGFLKIAANTLILVHYDQHMIPYTYVATAIWGPIYFYFFYKLLRRYSLASICAVSELLAILILGVLWFTLFFLNSSISAFIAMTWMYFGITLSFVIIKSQASLLLNVRQLRLYSGLPILSFIFGTMIAGMFLTSLPKTWFHQIEHLLLVSISLFFIAFLLLRMTYFYYGEELSHSLQKKKSAINHTAIKKKKLTSYLYLYQILFYTLGMILIYLSSAIAAETYERKSDALFHFFSALNFSIDLISLFLLAFVTKQLILFFGLSISLALYPGLISLFTIISSVSYLLGAGTLFFYLIIFTRILESVLDLVIATPALLCVYQAFLPSERTQVQSGAEGIAPPLGYGAAGLLLIFFHSIGNGQFSLILNNASVIAFLLLFLSILIYREYKKEFIQNASRRLLETDKETVSLIDDFHLLDEMIQKKSGQELLWMVEVVSESQQLTLKYLPQLVQHPDGTVAIAALKKSAQVGFLEMTPNLLEMIQTPTFREEIRAEALVAVCAINGFYTPKIYPSLLKTPPGYLHDAILLCSVRYGGLLEKIQAFNELSCLLQSEAEAARLHALKIMIHADPIGFYQQFLELLQDPSPTVRCTAIQAFGKCGSSRPLPQEVIKKLNDPRMAFSAIETLSKHPEQLLDLLDRALSNKYELQESVLLLLVTPMNLSRSHQTIEVLERHLEHPHLLIAENILKVLYVFEFIPNRNECKRIESLLYAKSQKYRNLFIKVSICKKFQELEELNISFVRLLSSLKMQIFYLLSLLHTEIRDIKDRIFINSDIPVVLETLELALTVQQYQTVSAVFDDQIVYKQELVSGKLETISLQDFLSETIATSGEEFYTKWNQLCAIHYAFKLQLDEVTEEISRSGHPRIGEKMAQAFVCLNEPELVSVGVLDLQSIHKIVERTIFMRSSPLFAKLDGYVLAAIAASTQEILYSPNSEIIVEGTMSGAIYMILKGEVSIHLKESELNRLQPLESFGEIALIDHLPASASATTLQESLLLKIDQRLFDAILRNYPQFAMGIVRLLLKHLRSTGNILVASVLSEGGMTFEEERMDSKFFDERIEERESLIMKKIAWLKRARLFADLPNNLMTAIANSVEEEEFVEGTTIIKERMVGEAMYLILYGNVKVHSEGVTLAVLSDGETFGEMSLIDDEPCSASVVALETTICIRVDRALFKILFSEQNAFVLSIINFLLERIKAMNKRLGYLSLSSSSKRK